jgi:CheY-like chemotaxis protein
LLKTLQGVFSGQKLRLEREGETEENNLNKGAWSRFSVLLVEDNVINRQIALESLEGTGLKVEVAENGLQAIEKATHQPFSLILMDIQMPEMDGYQASARIRADLLNATLPIIAMTAHAVAGYRENCLAMGMNDYVAKPIEPAILYTILANWIGADPTRIAVPPAEAPEAIAGAPDLPGIDVPAALDRLGHKTALLVRLVAMFAADFALSRHAIGEAIAGGELERASMLVHKIKGAAGNLSARELHRTAAALEDALIARRSDALAGLQSEFERAFEEVMAGAVQVEAS